MNSQHETQLEEGSVLEDRYEIERLVGRGRIGTVYKAKDKALDNSVLALKTLHPHLWNDLTLRSRLQNEVLLVRQLNHRNIIQVYDFSPGEISQPFVTMEYVESKSLETLLEEGKGETLSQFEKLRLLFLIAEAMTYAHHKGIIHRNLKPSNVLITRDEAVKLSDFAFGKALLGGQSLTKSGEIVGTPHYVAPELLAGKKADQRADVYSFGILTFLILSGRVPFEGKSFFDVADKHLKEPLPSLSTDNNPANEWQQAFVEICCAKDPRERFQSFDEVVDTLKPYFLGKPSASMPSSPSVLSIPMRKKKGFFARLFSLGK